MELKSSELGIMGLLLSVKSAPELTELEGVLEQASGQLILPGPCSVGARGSNMAHVERFQISEGWRAWKSKMQYSCILMWGFI